MTEHRAIKKLLNEQLQSIAEYDAEEMTENEEPAQKRPKSAFASILNSPSTSRKRTKEQLILDEISKYLKDAPAEDHIQPAEYWKIESKYPNVKKLAIKYMSTVASSAPVERLFSVAGLTFRPHRNRMSDVLFQVLMNIRSNSDIVKD